MAFSLWVRWLRPFHRPTPKTKKGRKAAAPLHVERLEDRVTPAQFVWTGNGGVGNTNWGAAVNWLNTTTNTAQAPTGALDDLVFDSRSPLNTRHTFNNLITPLGTPYQFNSITISASGYSLAGNQIILGSANPNSGFVSVSTNIGAAVMSLNVQMGGATGNNQFFNIDSGAQLTLSGKLSNVANTTGATLTKELAGNLTLTNDNSAFTGPIKLDDSSGTVTITNVHALGDTSQPTTVGTNSQLQVESVPGPINEPLVLEGPGTGLGISDPGALLNLSGNNTWAGPISLGSSSVTIGADAGTQLTISGQISDSTTADLTKEGQGQIIFSHVGGNTYRGMTIINNGILTIQDPQALGQPLPGGASPSSANGTIVNQNPGNGEVGTLQLDNTLEGDFTVLDEQITLNSTGFGGIGALDNLHGNNTWAGSVWLGSPAPNGSVPDIAVAATTNLTISGVVSSPNAADGFTKIQTGKLILNNHNTYKGRTLVASGVLNIRDSQALGTNGGAGTTVDAGAALELEVDGLPGTPQTDAHGRDLHNDSVTGINGNGPQLGLTIATNLTLFGTGINNTGALHSISGINVWTGNIFGASIGVEADPNASNTFNYFTHDYSLTVTGTGTGTRANTGTGTGTISGGLDKVDVGQLILPNPNNLGITTIEAGWVTIQDDLSLGAPSFGISDTVQPAVTVQSGAALFLKPLNPSQPLDLVKNLVLSGAGIIHPFPLISQKGALLSIDGNNLVGGPDANGHRSDIQLDGTAGIGVEQIEPPYPNPGTLNLTITSSISDFTGTVGGLTKYGSQMLILQGDGTYTGPVNIAEGVVRIQNNSALGTATSGTATSSDLYSTTSTTLAPGIAEVQSYSVSGTPGTYTLTFTDSSGSDSTTLSTSASAAQVAAALNSLPNVLAPNTAGQSGLVTVNLVGNIYMITFGGKYLGVHLPVMTVAAVTGTAPSNPVVILNGDGTSLELEHTLPLYNGGIQAGLGVWNDHLFVDSAGNTQYGDAPLNVLDSDNLWYGPISLLVNSTLEVKTNARLTIEGVIDDTNNLSPTGSSNLTLTGGGELALGGADTYNGTTFVSQGALLVENSRALGGTGVSPVETLTLNQLSGTFSLNFNGQNAGPFDASSATLATQVQNALNLLSTVSSVNGSVSVSQNGTVLTVTFSGSFTGFDQNLITVPSTSVGLTVVPGWLVHGAGGTSVASGASIELEGSLTVSGEPLVLQGQGLGTATTLPVGWFNEGPAPTNHGQTSNNLPVTGSVTGVAVDPTDANVIYIATAGGGAWKTKNGGLTWLPLFDSAPVQRLYVPPMLNGQFTLSFNGVPTSPFTVNTNTDPTLATLAAQIQTALDNLSSIKNLSPLPGNVTVTQSPVNPLLFYITFGGSLSQTTPPLLTAAGIGTASAPVVTDAGPTGFSGAPALYTGAIALDPHDSRIIYLGTGEANDASDSYYGTGVYKSTDAGQTWSQLTTTDSSNPLYGLGITQIVVDPGLQGTPTGRIFVATSDQVVNSPVPTAQAGVYRYDDATTQVQTLTLPTLTGAGTFTLTYGGSTTSPFNVNDPTLATDIATALNDPTFASIGGVGGSVTVTESPLNPLVFTIVFGGTLLAQPEPFGYPQNGTNYSPITNLPLDPGLMSAAGSGIANPIVSTSSTWVNLTATATNARLTLVGQDKVPPGTPGPNDDFRLSFPQRNITWSGLTLQYLDTTTPATGTAPSPGFAAGQGADIPVLYAALGTPGGFNAIDNAVYRSEDPTLAPTSAAATTWYVGDPGLPQDEVQQIKVTPWTSGGKPVGNYQLSFGTSPFEPAIPGLPSDTDSMVGLGNPATTIQAVLNSLSTIGGVGGSVTVILDPASDVTTLLFDVTWGGSMQDSQEPLIVPKVNGGVAVTVSELKKGSGIDTRSAGEFPVGNFPNGPPRNGNIKITSVEGAAPPQGFYPTFNQVTLYAAVTNPTTGSFLEIDKSTNGGLSWTTLTTTPPNYMATQGQYDSTIVAVNANTVYVGGQVSPNTALSQIYRTTDGGATWLPDLSVDANNNGPHTSQHAMAVDSSNRVIVVGDGGVWRFDPATKTWSDLNGDLAITQFNSVAEDPTDPNTAFGGSRYNGTETFTGTVTSSPAWAQVDNNDGGEVAIDPTNPNNVYHVQSTSVWQTSTATLQGSTTGGTAGSWTTLLTEGGRYFPFLIDNVNPARLLVGGNGLQESLSYGSPASWHSLNSPLGTVSALAAAAYQGNFAADPGFTQVTDLGANTYDPNTVYVTDGTFVYVTKNYGRTWKNRTTTLAGLGSIADLEVDPTNRDTAYIVRDTFDGVGRKVYKTTNAGLSWTDITFDLPNVPVYKLVIDPRTGNLYVGAENGVYLLPAGATSWQRFGTGLANVQVRDLELNQVTNTLLAGTYGRSMYQLFLDDGAANAGALRAVSGFSNWNGPIFLNGASTNAPVWIGANGTQGLQNGAAEAQLNIQGTIADSTMNGDYRLVKVGEGNVILSGSDTYGGITEVQTGALIVHNPLALGSPDATNGYTVVDPGAALDLQSDLQEEPITLNGNGFVFNGHYTGALRNVSNNNTYTGALTLATNATVGVDPGSTLTIGTSTTIPGTGQIQDTGTPYQLTKELTGTLILNSANTYTGNTEINQGALQVQNAQALGSTAAGTDVLDGAQLQIQTPAGGPPVVVSGEALTLSGTGLFNTGALLDTGGNNTWQGPITLDSKPVLLVPTNVPASVPPSTISVGTTAPTDTLTINGSIGEAGGSFSLSKVDLGTVALAQGNTYSGLTTVAAGALQVQDPNALGTNGTAANGTVVTSGGVLELDASLSGGSLSMPNEYLTLNGYGRPDQQLLSVSGTAGTFSLSFNNVPTSALPFNATALQIQNALNGLSSITSGGGSVTVVPLNGNFLIVFNGPLATTVQPLIGTSNFGRTTATVTSVINGGEGALNNISGTGTWTGPVILQSNTAVGAVASTTLTISGPVQDPATGPIPDVAAASLSKVGPGTLLLPNSNSYSGQTFINNGILAIQNNQSLGVSPPEEQTVTLLGNSGTFNLTFNGATTLNLDVNDPNLAIDLQAALDNLASIGGVGGSVTVTQEPAPNINVYQVVFGGSLQYVNSPRMLESSTPGLPVNVSVVVPGPDQTTVNRGGTLQLQNVAVTTESLTLNGTGFTNLGALENFNGTSSSWTSPITLGSTATVNVPGGSDTLTLNGVIGDNGAGNGLTEIGAGTLLYSGTAGNTYTGVTTVNDGTLQLDKAPISEVQQLSIFGTTGNYFLSFNGVQQTTPSLSTTDGAGLIQAALDSIPALNGNTTVNLVSAGVYSITFGGAMSLMHEPQIVATADPANAVGTSPAVAVEIITDGSLTPLAVAGNLVVGDGVAGAGTDVVQLLASNQIGSTSAVQVNSDGLLDLNDWTDTIGSLTVNDGSVTTGAGTHGVQEGQLTVSSLNMTGGSVSASQAGSNVTLNGDVMATSDTSGPATLSGSGALSLGGTTRTFTVNDGPKPSDMVVSTTINGAGGLIKDGSGRLDLGVANSYIGTTTVKNGDLQVNGTVGVVSLAAGSLSGTGTVGAVSVPSPTSGTIDPGDNGAAIPIGTLSTSGDVTLAAGATYYVDLAHTSAGSPVAGVDNDLLSVNGNVNLNGATLAGLPAPSVQLGDVFTIIRTTGGGTISSNQFAQGAYVFLGSSKFTITYNATSVVLTRVLASATVTVASSQNPSTYGQRVTYLATVTPEAGAPAIPTSDTVTFTFDGFTYAAQPLNSSGQATFDPQTATSRPLSVGSHILHVVFNADNSDSNYNNTSSADLSPAQAVNQAVTSLSVGSVSPVYGQPVTLTATLTPLLSSLVAGSAAPTNNVSFTVGTTAEGSGPVNSSNQATSNSVSGLTVGSHSYTVSYAGDSNYKSTSTNGFFTVAKDNANVAVNWAPAGSTASYGTPITLSATITPAATGSTGVPTGTAVFWDGPVNTGTRLGQATLSGGTATLSPPLTTLRAGAHTFNVSYAGDGNYNSATGGGNTLTVTANNTSTAVISSVNPSLPGQQVTFTATVSDSVAGGPTPTGSVTFTIDSGTPSNAFNLNSSGVAVDSTTTLATGSHTVVVNYFPANSNFNPSTSPTLTQTVDKLSQTGLTSSLNPSAFGQNVIFTVTVKAGNGYTGTPGGSVQFLIDHVNYGSAVALSGGQASVSDSGLGNGSHSIDATYSGDSVFAGSSAPTLTQTVIADATATSVGAAPPSSTYGQTVTLTATITNTNTSATVNGGTVNFYDGSAATGTFLGTSGTVSGGTASLPTAAIPAGASHTITAVYSGTPSLQGSTGTLSPFVVSPAHTSTAVSAAPTSSIYGQTVTLTATVTNNDTAVAVSGGTVSFYDGSAATGTLLGSSGVSGGTAVLPTAAIPAGTSHTITAVYASATNFAGSTGVLTPYAVSQAHTSTAVNAQPASTSTYGQTVTLTAVLTNTDGTGAAVSGGTVSFYDGSAATGTFLGISSVSGGTASVQTAAIPAGPSHTLTAVYASAPNFVGSTGTTPYAVSQASTGTTLTSAPNPSSYGQEADFTATVTSAYGPASGSVTFVVDGGSQVVPLDANGQAVLRLSNLAIGQHTVSASFATNANFIGSSAPNTITQVVTQASSSTVLSSGQNPSPYGQAVTFTATVTSAGGAPTGSVTFFVDGAAQSGAVPLNSADQAAFTYGSFTVGGHAITASYSGDTNFTGSVSPALTQVAYTGTSTTLTGPSGPVAVGQPATFTATVISTNGGGATPTGYVVFVIDGVNQPAVPLNAAGQASYTISSLAVGSHTVSATYVGATGFSSSASSQPVSLYVAAFLGSPDAVWINQVYLDLLHRPADANGLSYWGDQLEAGVPRNTVALAILGSDEYRTDFVIKLYSDLLGRTPSAADLQTHLNFLRGGGTFEQLTATFLGSSEYFQRSSNSDFGAYTNAVFQYVLGHPANATGQQYWSRFLQTNSLYSMALLVLESPERAGRYVAQLYQTLLGRTVDSPQTSWFTMLQTGTRDEVVIAGIVSSDEYFMRFAAAHNTQPQERAWINQIYVDLLGRTTDAPSSSYWTNVLEHGTPRLNVTEQIVNSGEYRTRLIASLFESLLHRAPSANDTNVYLNYLLQGGTVEGMKAQILGSPEYYFGRGAGSPSGFLNAAYQDVLQRPLDSAGTAYWGGKLGGGEDRTTLTLEMLTTLDADEVQVQDDYYATLRRGADAVGMAYWVGQLQAGFRDEYVLAELAATKEYYSRFGNG